MAAHIDDAGTVVGRYEGSAPGLPALLLGSHIDTVRNAGRFDGTLGVLVAIEAVARLSRQGRRLPFAIEVLAFGDEEGVRFPATLSGSRAVAGIFAEETLEGRDADGVTLRDALTAFGCDPRQIPAIARKKADVLGYLELHIEQGTVLQEAGQPLGIVSGISGAMRLSFQVIGESGHAGTLAMHRRRDAMTGAAEMILAVEKIAAGRSNVVATVGNLSAAPGAVNVVAGAVDFTLDLRTQDDLVRSEVLADIRGRCHAIALRRGLRLRDEIFYDQQTTYCDDSLKSSIGEALERHGFPWIETASGAGHDGLAIAALCPMAMLFIRCKDGISHHPDEHVDAGDIEMSVMVLVDILTTYRSNSN